MKKVFKIFAASLAVAGMVGFVSCSKDNGNNGGKTDPSTEPSVEPSTEPSAEPEDIIVIDGNFDDWAKLSNVVTVSMDDANKGWSQEDNQRIDCLKTVKITADGSYIYMYLEVDKSVEYQGGVDWAGNPLGKATAGPLDIYIDADCATTSIEVDGTASEVLTGGINWCFDCGWEYFIESSSIFDSKGADVTDALLFKFTGKDHTDIWAVDPPAREDVTQDGFATGKGVVEGDIIKYELSFIRAFMPLIQGNKIGVGVIVQSTNWTLNGLLPQVKQDTEHLVPTKLIEVTLPDAD